MFDIALSNNPATALTAGTSSNLTFDLVQPATPGGQSIRSVSSVNLTLPHTLKIGHATRKVKGLQYSYVYQRGKVPDITIDRHLVRFDKAVDMSPSEISDPDHLVTYGAQVVLEIPRLGLESPTHQQVMDNLLRCVVLLNPNSLAGLMRLTNGES